MKTDPSKLEGPVFFIYETIKAQKEIALSSNTRIIIMGNNKGAPVLINGN